MDHQHATISYSGLYLDAFITGGGAAWLTLTSLATGLGIHRQTVHNWLTRELAQAPKSIDVRVGVRKTPTKAYSVDVAADFIEYMADKGNLEAKALRSATLRADLTRSIKEANGEQVTTAQHEGVRTQTRLEYLKQWARDRKGNGAQCLSVAEVREGGFTNPDEVNIVYLEGLVARQEVLLTGGHYDKKALRHSIKDSNQQIQKLSTQL